MACHVCACACACKRDLDDERSAAVHVKLDEELVNLLRCTFKAQPMPTQGFTELGLIDLSAAVWVPPGAQCVDLREGVDRRLPCLCGASVPGAPS